MPIKLTRCEIERVQTVGLCRHEDHARVPWLGPTVMLTLVTSGSASIVPSTASAYFCVKHEIFAGVISESEIPPLPPLHLSTSESNALTRALQPAAGKTFPGALCVGPGTTSQRVQVAQRSSSKQLASG